MLGCCGRVLPMADVPLDLVARVESTDPDDPERTRTIRGQVAIATTPGTVREILLSPHDPPVNDAVLAAIAAADVVSLGPGSWYTSVLPHLLVPRLRAALAAAQARVVAVLNLEPQPGETDGFSPEEHLHVLQAHLGGVALHTVIADADSVVDRRGLLSAVRECGARADPGSGGRGRRLGTARSRALVGRTGLRGRDAVRPVSDRVPELKSPGRYEGEGDAAQWRLTWQRAPASAR